jgi:beta-lactamase superfamily II metal-dependent hydrolase
MRGDFYWYWWNCWPSLNELKWEVIFVDIGGIVDHHSMSWCEGRFFLILVELLTITQWVEVRGHSCWYWWNCWPSLNELNWEVIFVDIGVNDYHNSMSLGERWFLLILVELLTITQWVEVRGDFCWYLWNCWPSLNELMWEVILVDIGGILTITQWVKVRGDFCWYWWNFWPSRNELKWEVIFIDIGGIVDHHSMS